MKKKKIFVISDHPFSPSGVGTQTRNVIESLISTGEYSFICFGGAIKHDNYQPQKIDPHGEDWVIYPVDNYGSQETVRSIIRTEKPDMLWFMTDPRFFPWLWEIEDEIRSLIPMVYYHVWDNYPYPVFNKVWYNSCDHVACISKVTHDIVKTVAPDTDSQYIPHAVNSEIFKALEEKEILELRKQAGLNKDDFIIFWNNRNARRKQSGSLIFWFAKFLDKVGKNKAKLIMHTEPNDPNGPDLIAQINSLGLINGEVRFSKQKVEPQHLAAMYNMADVTVNIADAEGFGLATLESLSCATPIVVTMTGGLQEQVTDGENWFGIGIEPNSKAVIGSQDIPFIYEDRISEDDFIEALEKIYKMSKKDRQMLGLKGREHVMKNYNFDKFQETWRETIKNIHNKFGSWETRTGYKSWELLEV